MKLERIKQLNDQLTILVQDPQPGLIGWCLTLHETMNSLRVEWLQSPDTTLKTSRFEIREDGTNELAYHPTDNGLDVWDLTTDPDTENVVIISISSAYGTNKGRMNLAKGIVALLSQQAGHGPGKEME